MLLYNILGNCSIAGRALATSDCSAPSTQASCQYIQPTVDHSRHQFAISLQIYLASASRFNLSITFYPIETILERYLSELVAEYCRQSHTSSEHVKFLYRIPGLPKMYCIEKVGTISVNGAILKMDNLQNYSTEVEQC